MVGVRDWEVVQAKKIEKVDLIYVYNESNLEELKKIDAVQNILSENQKGDNDVDSPFEITHKEDNTEEDIVISNKVNKKIQESKNDDIGDFDGIDFDDI